MGAGLGEVNDIFKWLAVLIVLTVLITDSSASSTASDTNSSVSGG